MSMPATDVAAFKALAALCVLLATPALGVQPVEVLPPVPTKVVRESRERPDIADEQSPKGLRVVQISTDPELASHHLYPEAHMFTPDSKRFVFHRMSAKGRVGGQFWLCDIADNFALRQLTDEKGAHGRVAVSPDGKWMYYLVDRTRAPERLLKLKRLSLETFERHTLLVLDGPIPGTDIRPKSLHGASAVSSDGKRLCTFAFLGDGKTENPPFGILVFDLEKPSVKLIFQGTHFNNMHLQYCRSLDPALSHDILIQHNHGSVIGPRGQTLKLVGGAGADLHVIRDDGTHWRDVPIGRDGVLAHTGHEQWRGRMGTVISSMHNGQTRRHHLFESWPIPTDDATSHKGSAIPGARNIDLTRTVAFTNFNHFSMSLCGVHIVARHERQKRGDDLKLYIGTLRPGEDTCLKVQYLLSPKSARGKEAFRRGQSDKPRPFFSPDARMVFFHSNIDGPCQIFVATGYEFPEF